MVEHASLECMQSAAIDFNALALSFPGSLPGDYSEPLNRSAYLAGFGHPFRSNDAAQNKIKLIELMSDPMFQLSFTEFFRHKFEQILAPPAPQKQPAAGGMRRALSALTRLGGLHP